METRTGSCHCKAVEFEVDLEDGFENLRRCNCSLCSRKGAVMAGVTLDRLRVVRGTDKLSLYQWNTKQAKHFFCSVCGIYTHHQPSQRTQRVRLQRRVHRRRGHVGTRTDRHRQWRIAEPC